MLLNASQERAVNSDEQYLQIIAGPGTGKTLTLASRIQRVVEKNEISSDRILALTFTNNAVHELRTRLIESLGEESANEIRIMTYHAFSTYLISLDPELVGLRPQEWESADEWDQEVILVSVKGFGSTAKGGMRRLRALRQLADSTEDVSVNDKAKLHSYKERLLALQMVDYDTMLEMGSKIIENKSDKDLNIDHVFLDEFQDNSPLQWALVSALIKKNKDRKLTVVGDPHQEIYQFLNHWNASSFRAMDQDFPSSHKVYLDTNYRSSQEICDLAAEMIGTEREAKLTSVRGYLGDLPTLEVYESAVEELQALRDRVRGYLQNHTPENVAVLVRTNTEVDKISKYLFDSGIPVETYFNRALLSNPYVRLVHCLYKHVTHPNDVYLTYLLTSNQSRLFSRGQVGLIKSLLGQGSLSAGIETSGGTLRSRHGLKPRFDDFSRLLSGITDILRETRDFEVLKSLSLELLTRVTARSSEQCLSPELSAFFEWISRSSQAREDQEEPFVPWIVRTIRTPALPHRGSVHVQTVHSAKGLEWDVVLLPNVQMGTYPFPFNSDVSQDKNVLFVGLTRAKSALRLSATGSESVLLAKCRSLRRIQSKAAGESVYRKRFPNLYGPLPRIAHSVTTPRGLAAAMKKLRI